MDDLESIHNPSHDTTLAIMKAGAERGALIYAIYPRDLSVEQNCVFATARHIEIGDIDNQNWYHVKDCSRMFLCDFACVFMRKDPPFNMNYIYTTYYLELAQKLGTPVYNSPAAIRDCNEKMIINWFPDCITPTLVSSDFNQMQSFAQKHGTVILKPLDGMGGDSIFKLKVDDANFDVAIELVSQKGSRPVMLQRFIPEIRDTGDKRILLIGGNPVPYALKRMPAPGKTRANLAAGGHYAAVELTDQDRHLCHTIAPMLQAKGLTFVGLDVIGDYITEINVTCPTNARELNRLCGLDIGRELLDYTLNIKP